MNNFITVGPETYERYVQNIRAFDQYLGSESTLGDITVEKVRTFIRQSENQRDAAEAVRGFAQWLLTDDDGLEEDLSLQVEEVLDICDEYLLAETGRYGRATRVNLWRRK